MRKDIQYNSIEDGRLHLHLLRKPGSLLKTASVDDWLPEVKTFVNNLVPKDNYIYTLCNALGAGEYWGSNVNGDYFPEGALKQYHDTFVRAAKPFMFHDNKPTSKYYGEVLFSTYNPMMHRVELVVGYDTTKLPKRYVEKIENNELVQLSMGCRVPYDVCSICENVAPTPAQYCDCIKQHGMNHIFPDGRKVYVINTEPEFFDISIVLIPADKTARILTKINVQPKQEQKTASVKPIHEEFKEKLFDFIPDLSWDKLVKTAAYTKTPECLAYSLKHANQYLKPHEVQVILALQKNMSKLAQVLYKERFYLEGKAVGDLKQTSPVALPFSRDLNIKTAAVEALTEEQTYPSLSYSSETLSGDNGILSQLAAIANLSALVGMVMGQNVDHSIPLLLSGANLVHYLTANNQPTEVVTPEPDLMLHPLVYAKQASVSGVNVTSIYNIPLLYKLGNTISAVKKEVDLIKKEAALRREANKLIKKACRT